MSFQTMNVHGVKSVTVTTNEETIRTDGTIYYVQRYTFRQEDGHRLEITTFSDAPGALKLDTE